MRGNTGHQNSNRVQMKASFKCKVIHEAGRKRSRRIGGKKKKRERGWRKEGGRGGRKELGIIAPIDEVTLGGLQRDCEGE